LEPLLEANSASLGYDDSFKLPVSMILIGLRLYMETALMIVALMDKAATTITWLLRSHVLLGERELRYASNLLMESIPFY